MAAQHPRLQRRNGTYYVQVAVPRHQQPLLGKREVCRSLGTAVYKDALQELRLQSQKIDAVIQQAATTGQLDAVFYPVRHKTTHVLPEKGMTLAELMSL